MKNISLTASLITMLSFSIFLLMPLTALADSLSDSLMRVEADRFLANLPKNLQHRQALAIRRAIGGDCSDLEAVRHSRNTVTPVSDNVSVRMLSPTLRLYEPKGCTARKLPLLVYLHGGGWTFGSLNSCARYCDAMVAEGGLKVVAVDYRLAPEHPFPAGLDDCVAALNFVFAHAEELGVDTTRISVGGDSSGGNLALATSLSDRCLGRISSLVLFYPVTKAFDDKSESWKSYAAGFGLDAELMHAFNDAYCVHANPRDKRISIGLCNDTTLAMLPPTLLVAAGRDILCCQGKELAVRLPHVVTRVEFKDAVHLFITVPGQETAFRRAVSLSHDFLTVR